MGSKEWCHLFEHSIIWHSRQEYYLTGRGNSITEKTYDLHYDLSLIAQLLPMTVRAAEPAI